MFRAFEPWHLIVLVLLVVILFGWKRLPDAARSLGRSARILKSEVNEFNKDASDRTVKGEAVQDDATASGQPTAAQPKPQPQVTERPAQTQGYPEPAKQADDVVQGYPGETR